MIRVGANTISACSTRYAQTLRCFRQELLPSPSLPRQISFCGRLAWGLNESWLRATLGAAFFLPYGSSLTDSSSCVHFLDEATPSQISFYSHEPVQVDLRRLPRPTSASVSRSSANPWSYIARHSWQKAPCLGETWTTLTRSFMCASVS